jgi:hypothetical protein
MKLTSRIKKCIVATSLLSIAFVPDANADGTSRGRIGKPNGNAPDKPVRKGGLVTVGDDAPTYTAFVDETSSSKRVITSPAEDTTLGIQYYPLKRLDNTLIDKGPARLSNRKFKWRNYVLLKTSIAVKAVDYWHDIHAVAAVSGTKIPTTFEQSGNGRTGTPFYINLGKFGSSQINTFDGTEKIVPYDHINKEIDNQAIEETGPTVESYYVPVSCYGFADIDSGWASEARASVNIRQHTLPTSDSRQWTVQEAFYFPYAIR